jgi:hypothetical protein
LTDDPLPSIQARPEKHLSGDFPTGTHPAA